MFQPQHTFLESLYATPLSFLFSNPYTFSIPVQILLVYAIRLAFQSRLIAIALITYWIWGFFFDPAPWTGERAWLQPRIRNWLPSRLVCERLGVKIVRDEKAWEGFEKRRKGSPQKYIFGTHPHGLSLGRMTALRITNVCSITRRSPSFRSYGHRNLCDIHVVNCFWLLVSRIARCGKGNLQHSWNIDQRTVFFPVCEGDCAWSWNYSC